VLLVTGFPAPAAATPDALELPCTQVLAAQEESAAERHASSEEELDGHGRQI
jgi:hypothetical protein